MRTARHCPPRFFFFDSLRKRKSRHHERQAALNGPESDATDASCRGGRYESGEFPVGLVLEGAMEFREEQEEFVELIVPERHIQTEGCQAVQQIREVFIRILPLESDRFETFDCGKSEGEIAGIVLYESAYQFDALFEDILIGCIYLGTWRNAPAKSSQEAITAERVFERGEFEGVHDGSPGGKEREKLEYIMHCFYKIVKYQGVVIDNFSGSDTIQPSDFGCIAYGGYRALVLLQVFVLDHIRALPIIGGSAERFSILFCGGWRAFGYTRIFPRVCLHDCGADSVPGACSVG